MASKVVLRFLDNSQETSTVAMSGVTITDANYVAQDGLADAAIAAINGLSLGTHVHTSKRYSESDGPGVNPPASPFAQRETKWLVRFTNDVTGQQYRMEIPCADLDLLTNNSEYLDLTAGPGLTFKNDFEAFARVQEHDASYSTVTVQSVQFVSRNR